MKIYLVGGAVRDKLLGLPIKDRDWVVVGATPEAMIEQGFKPIGKDFPVFLHPETKEEYALARTERKSGKGYKGFTFHTSPDVSLEDDLKRRDLTINAIAEDHQGNLIDPFNGKTDLEKSILRHISPAFIEDPLRTLRTARFAATLGFKIAEETLCLLSEIAVSDELDTLVPERVWNEMEKAMRGQYPARFVLVLRACNALSKLFPEIDILFGIPQRKKDHPEIDIGLHIMMTLNQSARLSNDPMVRFAALVHDLGKGDTPQSEWPNHYGHEERSVKLINKLCDRYRIPNKYRKLACAVAKYHLDCHRIMEMAPTTILKKLEQLDAFRKPAFFQQFLLACEANARGHTHFEDKTYHQARFFLAAFEVANQIDSHTLKKQGFKGKTLGLEIKKRQTEKIQRLLKTINILK